MLFKLTISISSDLPSWWKFNLRTISENSTWALWSSPSTHWRWKPQYLKMESPSLQFQLRFHLPKLKWQSPIPVLPKHLSFISEKIAPGPFELAKQVHIEDQSLNIWNCHQQVWFNTTDPTARLKRCYLGPYVAHKVQFNIKTSSMDGFSLGTNPTSLTSPHPTPTSLYFCN